MPGPNERIPPANQIEFMENNIHSVVIQDQYNSCPICHVQYGKADVAIPAEDAVRIDPCNHVFGRECLKKHVADNTRPNHNTCPLCREILFRATAARSGRQSQAAVSLEEAMAQDEHLRNFVHRRRQEAADVQASRQAEASPLRSRRGATGSVFTGLFASPRPTQDLDPYATARAAARAIQAVQESILPPLHHVPDSRRWRQRAQRERDLRPDLEGLARQLNDLKRYVNENTVREFEAFEDHRMIEISRRLNTLQNHVADALQATPMSGLHELD